MADRTFETAFSISISIVRSFGIFLISLGREDARFDAMYVATVCICITLDVCFWFTKSRRCLPRKYARVVSIRDRRNTPDLNVSTPTII